MGQQLEGVEVAGKSRGLNDGFRSMKGTLV
jgi:hypothetical protein